MSLSALLTQTVLVRHAVEGALDRYRVATVSYDAGTEYPARLEQVGGSETSSGRDAVVADWALYLPADAAIGARDQVEADGTTFEVVGPPEFARTPRGVSHVVARLRYVQG